jgi:hypothetical protein
VPPAQVPSRQQQPLQQQQPGTCWLASWQRRLACLLLQQLWLPAEPGWVSLQALAPYDSAPTSCVCYDYSGLYLAVGGPDVRVYSTKQDFAQVGCAARPWLAEARRLVRVGISSLLLAVNERWAG